MEFEITGISKTKLFFNESAQTTEHLGTEISLQLSANLLKEQYFGEDELPTREGSQCLTIAFIQGLIGNIHYCHQKEQWDSAEHLRYIIAELERGFIAQVNVQTKENK
jgi:hypothetical protein